jgi:hypothetical protein
MAGNLYEEQYTFLFISRSVLLRMRNISDKFTEKIETQILCSKAFFFNQAVCDTTLKNIIELNKPQMTCRMRIECWILKAARARTHTHIIT